MLTTNYSTGVKVMTIEIAGQQWHVCTIGAHRPELMVDGTSRLGACWPAHLNIWISDELRGDQVPRVVMHELTHAYIYSTQAITPESWSEEDLCEFVAIYGQEISEMCTLVCHELFPEVKLRTFQRIQREERA